MESIDKILELTEEFKDNLKKAFGKYTHGVEFKDGRKVVILTDKKGNRFVLSILINEAGYNLISTPENEAMSRGLTELERELLHKAANRAIYNVTSKFQERTGWVLDDVALVFRRGLDRIFYTFSPEEGPLITEGEMDD